VHDFERSARYAGVRYRHPSKFPIGAVAASRAVLWLQQHQPDKANSFVHAVFRAFSRTIGTSRMRPSSPGSRSRSGSTARR